MKKVLYIGEIPANYGGITRKSELLEKKIKENNHTSVINIDVKNKKVLSFVISMFKIFHEMKSADRVIYCLDDKRLLILLRLQSILYKEKLDSSIVVLAGGEFNNFLGTKSDYLKEVGSYWIEIKSQISSFKKNGYRNISYFPNPRIQDVIYKPIKYNRGRPLKLLYYSQISKEKGLIDVIAIVNKLNHHGIEYTLDFYGWIVDDVRDVFNKFIDSTHNVRYKGFNDTKDKKKYFSLINEYDIMLFPTYWHGEGIAGACVDAKIAGVTIIASNHNFNNEIVDVDKDEGIIVEKGDIDLYVKHIENLYYDPEKLNKLKEGSYDSKSRFDVDTYQSLFTL